MNGLLVVPAVLVAASLITFTSPVPPLPSHGVSFTRTLDDPTPPGWEPSPQVRVPDG